MDELQMKLESALVHRAWSLMPAVFSELCGIARPIVRRFYPEKLDDEHDALARQLVNDVLYPDKPLPDGRPSKLLWPGGDGSAERHRQLVFASRLKDNLRRERTRHEIESAFAVGKSPEEIRSLRREHREGRATPVTAAPESTSIPTAHRNTAEWLLIRRSEVVALISRIPAVRRRIAVALEYGVDPFPWAEALAKEIDESVSTVQKRFDTALARGGEAIVRVLFPGPVTEKSSDAFRKLVKHGEEDLRKLLTEQPDESREFRSLLTSHDAGGD